MRWISEIGLRTIDWPPQSPDINPIENVWQQLKLMGKNKKPKNKEEQIITIHESFQTIKDQVIHFKTKGGIVWRSVPYVQSKRKVNDIIRENDGLKGNAKNIKSDLDAFECIISDHIL